MATYQVGASSDDWTQVAVGSPGVLTNAQPAITANGSGQIYLALRFTNVTIAQGDMVKSADLQLDASSSKFPVMNAKIYAQAADNATTGTTATNDISGRSLTSANVLWHATDGGSFPGFYTSVDITSVVQEVINRPGWVSGNAIVFILVAQSSSDVFSCYSYDQAAADGAKFDVTSVAVSNDTGAGADATTGIQLATPNDTGSGADTNSSLTTTVTDADTGTGADAESGIQLATPNDTGSGTDAGESITTTSSDADTGAGADTNSSLTVTTSDADTGTGTDAGETIAVPFTDADTGTGTDAGELITIPISDADTGTGVEGAESITIPLSDADTGTGTDAGENITLSIADADTGTLTDSETNVSLVSYDSGAGVDATAQRARLRFPTYQIGPVPENNDYPETANERRENQMMAHFTGLTAGENIWILTDNTVTTQQPPHWSDVKTVYYGGHDNYPTGEDVDLLIAAGYTFDLV